MTPATGGVDLLLRGVSLLTVSDVLADAPEFGSIVARFEGAWWRLLADGRFFFEPSRLNDPLSNSYILQGVYEKDNGTFILQAESYGNPESLLALEAIVRPDGGQYVLDCLFFEESSTSPIRRITQTLTAEDKRGMLHTSRDLNGVPSPALYDIEMSGRTTSGSFDSVQVCLYTTTSFSVAHSTEADAPHLSINNGSALDMAQEENGTCLLLMPFDTFASASWGSLPPDWRFDFSVRDGHVRLSLKDIPRDESVFSWCEVEEVLALDEDGLRQGKKYFEARAVLLDCRVSGDTVVGSIQADGLTRDGQAGRYEATIAGRRAPDAPQSVARLEQKIRLRARTRDWLDRDIFDGAWQSQRFGQVRLCQSGEAVTGSFSAAPHAALTGTASERRLVFSLAGGEGDEGGVLRAARGGQFLAGFSLKAGGGEFVSELLYRPDHSSRLVAELLRTTDPLAWNKQANVFKSLGRDGEALILYGKIVEACAEKRRQAVPYSEEWATFFSYEWGALLDYMNCYQMRNLRLSNVRQQLREGGEAAAFDHLLHEFGHAIRMQAELTAWSQKVKAEEGVIIPDFGARLAGQIELWRSSLSDEAARLEALESSQRALAELLKVLVAAGSYEQALVVAESARARAFADLMQNRIYRERVHAALSSLRAEEVESFLDRTMANTAPVELESLKQTARKHRCTFVEYFLNDSDLFVWVILPDGRINFKHRHQEGLERNLIDCVGEARARLGVRSREAVLESAAHLPPQFLPRLADMYRLLVEPVAQWLPEKDSEPVIFIPHGMIFLIPFPALFDHKKYLVERHTISVAPSVRFVETTHHLSATRKTYPPGLLVAGDPLMPELVADGQRPAEKLPQLEFARKEAQQIAHQLGTTALLGAKASKARILDLLPQQQFVHLATHALINDQKQAGRIPGAIALAPSDGDDGFLTAEEIAGLHLQAKLVVLSACNTGRGHLSADGIVGLTRAFLTAGAECVVASLWAVADRSTQELMVEFYENLRFGLAPANALRQAMLTFKAGERYDNPLYWAAFTITGQTRTPLFEVSVDGRT